MKRAASLLPLLVLVLGLATPSASWGQVISLTFTGNLTVSSATFLGTPMTKGDPFQLSLTFDPSQFAAAPPIPWHGGLFETYSNVGAGSIEIGGTTLTIPDGTLKLIVENPVLSDHDSIQLHFSGIFGSNNTLALDVDLVSNGPNVINDIAVPDFSTFSFLNPAWDNTRLLHFGAGGGQGFGPIVSASYAVQAPSAVPEASTYGLLAAGSLLAGIGRRRWTGRIRKATTATLLVVGGLSAGLASRATAEIVQWKAEGKLTSFFTSGLPDSDALVLNAGDPFKLTFLTDTAVPPFFQLGDSAYFSVMSGDLMAGGATLTFDGSPRLYVGDDPPSHTFILDATSGPYTISMLLSGWTTTESGLILPTQVNDLDSYDIVRAIHLSRTVPGGSWFAESSVDALELTTMPSAVPEPSTYGVFAAGAVCAGVWLRRRRGRQSRSLGLEQLRPVL